MSGAEPVPPLRRLGAFLLEGSEDESESQSELQPSRPQPKRPKLNLRELEPKLQTTSFKSSHLIKQKEQRESETEEEARNSITCLVESCLSIVTIVYNIYNLR